MQSNELLFHFTKADTAINYILKNNTLRFNSFKNVNDPRESKNWPFKLFSYYEENYKLYNKKIFMDLHNYAMDHIFISCFSIPTSKNINENDYDLRMWSQYADNHQGVCLVFNKERLENAVLNNTSDFELYRNKIKYLDNISDYIIPFPKEYPGFLNFNKFLYKRVLPFAHPVGRPESNDPYMINLERLLKLGISEYMEQHIRYFFKPLLFSKYKCWKDEQEYRYVIHSKKRHAFIDIPIQDTIEAIILGNDFPLNLQEDIFSFAKQHDFNVYKLYSKGWENHLFMLNIEDVEKENQISIQTSYPTHFYYERLYTQSLNQKGEQITIGFNFTNGEVSIID